MIVQMQAVNPNNQQERVFVTQMTIQDSNFAEFLGMAHFAWVLKKHGSIPSGWIPKIVYENEEGFFKLTEQGVVTQ